MTARRLFAAAALAASCGVGAGSTGAALREALRLAMPRYAKRTAAITARRIRTGTTRDSIVQYRSVCFLAAARSG